MSNNDFVFNSTDSLLFLQSGEEWFDAVIRSISMCIQYHVDFYYDGIFPKSHDVITSKTCVELNIYKYFHDAKKT